MGGDSRRIKAAVCQDGAPGECLGTPLTRHHRPVVDLQDLQQQLDVAEARTSAAEVREKGAAAEARELEQHLLKSAEDVARLSAEQHDARLL